MNGLPVARGWGWCRKDHPTILSLSEPHLGSSWPWRWTYSRRDTLMGPYSYGVSMVRWGTFPSKAAALAVRAVWRPRVPVLWQRRRAGTEPTHPPTPVVLTLQFFTFYRSVASPGASFTCFPLSRGVAAPELMPHLHGFLCI